MMNTIFTGDHSRFLARQPPKREVILIDDDGDAVISEEDMKEPEATQVESRMKVDQDDDIQFLSIKQGGGLVAPSSRSLSASSSLAYWDATADISEICSDVKDDVLKNRPKPPPVPVQRWDSDVTAVNETFSVDVLVKTDTSSSGSSRYSSISNETDISLSSGPLSDKYRSSSATSSVSDELARTGSCSPSKIFRYSSSSSEENNIFSSSLMSRKRKSTVLPPLPGPSRAPRLKSKHHPDVTDSLIKGNIACELIDVDSINDPFSTHVTVNALDSMTETPLMQPVIIADIGRLKGYFEKLSVGVQWEIARLMSLGKCDSGSIDVQNLSNLELRGTNAESAPKVVQILLPEASKSIEDRDLVEKAFARENASKLPYAELDLEEAALRDGRLQGLGFPDDWYGGKVQFIGLLQIEEPGEYKIVLEPASLGPSNRFARRFGSSRFLRIRLPTKTLHESGAKLIDFFSRPFVLCGRVFRAFFAKENNVFLVETAESYHDKTGCIVPGACKSSLDDARRTLLDFVEWHNPMSCNSNQTVAKWAARFALGLSNSVPGIQLQKDLVREIEEEISPFWDGAGKPTSEVEMTDGCGFANMAVLKPLFQKYQWETFPTAIQVRIGGAKGMLCLSPEGWRDFSDPAVSLRPSQMKIKRPLNYTPDPASLIIDVLRSSHLKSPSRLSAETIINLAENGVPHSVFIQLMEDGLNDLVAGLTQWEGDNAMRALWLNVAQVGGVIGQRKAREMNGEARARGLGDRDRNDDDDDEDDDDDGLKFDRAIQQRSTAWWADEISGCPSSLEETVMYLLDSGFNPKDLPVLAEKLKKVLTTAIHNYVIRYKIIIPKSCHGFIIPDPLGVLQPGEIHIKCSHRILGPDDMETDIIIGDILVTRHPCKVPTDVQKVKGVSHPRLSQYVDVIIFPIQGYRTLASMLGGGDYDGDKVIAIWQPEIVSAFRNADPRFADKPPGFDEQFSKATETVAKFQDRLMDYNEAKRIRELQQYLLGPLRDPSLVGQYSNMHDCAVYVLGYEHPESIRLAYMFCAVLDGSKTGLTVKPEVFARDKRTYQKRKPDWKETDEERQFNNGHTNDVNVKRHGLASHFTFIMDAIKLQGKQSESRYLNDYDKLAKQTIGARDDDLIAPWRDAEARAERAASQGTLVMKNELDLIAKHVRELRIHHREVASPKNAEGPRSPSKRGKKTRFTDMPIEKRQDMLRNVSRVFASEPKGLIFFSEREVNVLRASYAYLHDSEMGKGRWTRFPWDVAMRQLCAIKAGFASKTVNSEFYHSMTVLSSCKIVS